MQEKPDFYYDDLQRLRFSQNQRQAALSRYSYTKYDNLGRVTEVGECFVQSGQIMNFLNNPEWPYTNDQNVPVFDPVYTLYSEDETDNFNHGVSRGRVVSVTRRNDPEDVNSGEPVNITTLYKYDVHGNVNRLKQILLNNLVADIEYDYDLISGNVKTIAYNKG
jgi:hypothetical protein